MRKNILIVDDDPDVRTSVKNIFENEGNEVWSVENGVECLELLEKGFTGILLIDLMMPQMDGWATIKEIVKRGLQKKVNIIVIAAIGTYRHHKMKGLEPYVYDYIAKPFDIKELIENIKKIN
jgi:DNA-binding response OmpR family regulator